VCVAETSGAPVAPACSAGDKETIMAEVVKKKNDKQQLAEWHPLRGIRDLSGWAPPRETASVFRGFSAFDRAELRPAYDVTEDHDGYLLKVDVAGVKNEDLEILMTGHRVQISGKRYAEKEAGSGTVCTYEREYRSFVRGFTLPDRADLEHARSDLKDGVLTLAIPKLSAAQARRS
jgi:HSP20 family protein